MSARSTGALASISDTARWIAALRATESARPDALFHDPLAERLAGERGFAIARSMPGASTTAWAIALRTRALDEQILEAVAAGFDTVLSLAAGLDARPYRLELPGELRWIEVDLPALVAFKDDALADETPRCRLERIALDLSDAEARQALFARVGAGASRVLVLTEGLLMYLDADAVAGLATDLAAQPSFERWVTDLLSAPLVRFYQWRWEGQLGPADARFRFTPEAGAAFFAPFGWRVQRFRSTMVDAAALGRGGLGSPVALAALRALLPGLYAPLSQLSGVVTFEKQPPRS